MEGVVVSAKKAGSTVTVSVVSDGQGRFSFPSSEARVRLLFAEDRARDTSSTAGPWRSLSPCPSRST